MSDSNLKRGEYLLGIYLQAARQAIGGSGDVSGEADPRYWSFVQLYGEKPKADFQLLGPGWEKYWYLRNPLVSIANRVRASVDAWAKGSRSKERAIHELDAAEKEIYRVALLAGIAAGAAAAGQTAEQFLNSAAAAKGIAPEQYIAELQVSGYNMPLDGVDVVAAVNAIMGHRDEKLLVGTGDIDRLGGVQAWIEKNWRPLTGGMLAVGLLLMLKGKK